MTDTQKGHSLVVGVAGAKPRHGILVFGEAEWSERCGRHGDSGGPMTGAVRQALEVGFKSGPGLKAHQHLGADDEQAALIEPVLDVVLEGYHAS